MPASARLALDADPGVIYCRFDRYKPPVVQTSSLQVVERERLAERDAAEIASRLSSSTRRLDD